MTHRDFTSQGPFNTNFERDNEEHKSLTPEEDFASHSFPPMLGFPQQPYHQNYMNMGTQNAMFYQQPYPNQYMPQYSYGYGSSPYKGTGYSEKRGGYQGGYRKYNNQSPPTKHVIYSKKPKQPVKGEEGDLAADFSKLTVKDNGSTSTGHGLTEKLPSHIEKAQFFVIKSYSEEDVHKAIKYNVWCSTIAGNVKLHEAFVAADNQYPIYLLFSVNSSGHFVGVAEMKSAVDFDKNFDAWNQNHKWKGVFNISWIYIKDVPNRELRHLKNEYNEGKPVPNSRDCQEIPFEIGKQVLEIFDKYKNQTSILDDFDFYEKKQLPK